MSLLAACVDAPSIGETEHAVSSTNGVSLNGVSLNGVSLNGSSLTGVRSDTGETIAVDAVGRTMIGTLSNGSTLELHVDSATQLSGANSDIWSYGISYETELGPQTLCEAGALAVSGTWNATAAYAASTTELTFACRATSIAKCVEMGYKPWLGHADHMQSCVRLLRGDYCGTGVAYTITGNLVNLYDNAGIQADTELTWVPEAEWTPNGARCISIDWATRYSASGLPTPPCFDSRKLPTTGCGQSFAWGALLISEVYNSNVVAPTSSPTKSTRTSLR